MARFIRWQGSIAFVALTALVIVFLYFFAESLVKSAIVTSAESAFGAEVNVDDVKLAYSPLQISVFGLQVTDKELPTHNLFSFERASAGVDVWQYLFGKIIIEKLDVTELALGGERAKAGKVFADEQASAEESEESLTEQAKAMLPEVDMKLPDVKKLLKDSDLLTVKASEQLQASYKTEQAKLTALKKQLPNKEKLKYYQNKVKALSKVKVKSLDDIAKIKTDYEKIKAEFKADQALIKKAKKQVLASKKLLAQQVNDLKGAPNKDWKKIEKTYQLETLDGEDFAHIIFGEQARAYFQKAQWAYEKVAPFLESNDEEAIIEEKRYTKGRFIYFAENTPLPSVLIKQAQFSMKLEQGDFIINGEELTHQHWLRKKDSVVSISSSTNGDLELMTRFKVTKSGDFIADGNWSANNHVLSNKSLTTSKALTLAIDKANMNGKGTFTLVEGDILSDNHLSINKASYLGKASTKITNLLLDTIKSLDSLTLDVGIKGQLKQPSFSIDSSLNKALTGAFKKQVAGKVNEFKQKVNKGLNQKLASALKLGDSQTADLVDLEALLTNTDQALTDLKNSDVVKQQKKNLEDKLKKKAEEKIKQKANEKLKGKLGDLFGK